jgi:GT2 family glycosyltransferase
VKSVRAVAVLPVRGTPELLVECLDALESQIRALDEIVVVDDSPDRSLRLEGARIRVMHSGGRGPYAGRNLGWQSSDADVVLFVDVRSRPCPQWAGAIIAAFDDPTVAIAGSDVIVLPGPGLGARAAHAQQAFRAENFVGRPFFRPYLPTCNIAVRRADLERLGGFDEVRSGGDADLCWRLLADPGRKLVVVPDAPVEWVPRRRLRDFLEQNHRYGKSNYALRAAWAAAGAPTRQPVHPVRLLKRAGVTALRLGAAVVLGRDDAIVSAARGAGALANEIGYTQAARAATRERSFRRVSASG